MCGIVAYLGKKVAQPILIEGLKRLEYRGYDSAGVAFLGSDGIRIRKTSGRISALQEILDEPDSTQTLGIGHTRWATHGEPNTVNAHPHLDYTGKVTVVHNGIIENHDTLRTWLQNEGAKFASETDTEVIPHLVEKFYAENCLLEQPFVKDPERTVEDILKETIAKFGENITIRRFIRYRLGEE